VFHFIGSRVKTRRFQAMSPLYSTCAAPPRCGTNADYPPGIPGRISTSWLTHGKSKTLETKEITLHDDCRRRHQALGHHARFHQSFQCNENLLHSFISSSAQGQGPIDVFRYMPPAPAPMTWVASSKKTRIQLIINSRTAPPYRDPGV
jgi:hypothetical protein